MIVELNLQNSTVQLLGRPQRDYEIKDDELKPGVHLDEIVLQKIENLKALRNDFINFLNVLFTYSYDFNTDKFFNFLEKLLEFLLTQEANSYPSKTEGYLKIDQYRFIFYELFLYMTATMIEKEKFSELGVVLNNTFIIYNENSSKPETYSFVSFNQGVESLEKYRNERLKMNRLSISADLIKQRANIPNISFDRLNECDVLLYYVSIMTNQSEDRLFWYEWRPYLAAYRLDHFPILKKLISRRYFGEFKSIFDVNTIDELQQKVDKAKSREVDISFYRFPRITYAFDFEEIGKYP